MKHSIAVTTVVVAKQQKSPHREAEGDAPTSLAAVEGPSPEPEDWHATTPESALVALGSDAERGLSETEGTTRRRRIGPNEIPRGGGPSLFTLLWRQINNPIVYLLLAAAGLAVAFGKLVDGVVVLAAVVINAVVGFVQEFRAGRAIDALSGMVPQRAVVVRDGAPRDLPASELVPGDVIVLVAGDRVPADARLLAIKNLHVDEAALTGESVPVTKVVAPLAQASVLPERHNMIFGGTLVTSGTGRALVVATGARTELGRISHLLREATELQTPLTRALAAVGKWLTALVVAVAAVLLAGSMVRGYALVDAVLVAIALAVAAIPEGLPPIITIALAIGVQRMAARRAVVRKLPSVETLGSTTVICSDKTGTLTRNEMTVQSLITPVAEYAIAGVGYAPRTIAEDAITRVTAEGPVTAASSATTPGDVTELVLAAALCNDAMVKRDAGGTWRLTGDPTEGALVVAAMKAGFDIEHARSAWRRLDELPFESENQFMATLHHSPDRSVPQIFLKGAPEVVLARCVTGAAEMNALADVKRLAARGLRVLAVARKRATTDQKDITLDDTLAGFELLGLIGMMDPPREEAIEAVKRCQAAGVTVKMITGDHVGTAEAIGRQLGLLAADARGLNGNDIARLDDEALALAVRDTNVFARVAPEQKLRIVKALQRRGDVVAMTGDGVNDAPALKQANIGIAMGITGTSVAKESADVVLADDNFATIAAAVHEGRRIYDNLLKSVAFVLPTNLGLGFILIAAVAFFPVLTIGGELVPLMPVLPTQLLWVNLVASVALTLPLAFEVAEPDAMTRPPRDPRAPILGSFIIIRTFVAALLMAVGSVGLFLWEYWREASLVGHELALREAQTMAVTTIVFFQIFYLFNCRSLRASVFRIGFFTNPTVFVGIGVLVLLQALFIYAPFMQAIFKTAPLDLPAIAASALAGSIVLPVVTLEKALRHRRDDRSRVTSHDDGASKQEAS